jgi:hypothetical protein
LLQAVLDSTLAMFSKFIFDLVGGEGVEGGEMVVQGLEEGLSSEVGGALGATG